MFFTAATHAAVLSAAVAETAAETTHSKTANPGASTGLWVRAGELARLPTTGCAWQSMLDAANSVTPANATISDQNSNHNVETLAAALVFARTSNPIYQDKVTEALETLVAAGKPGDRTLAWAREVGAYALAADLVGYRTTTLETWLRNVAEVWIAEDNRTLLDMFKARPNNWGAHGFGSLALANHSSSAGTLRRAWNWSEVMRACSRPPAVVSRAVIAWVVSTTSSSRGFGLLFFELMRGPPRTMVLATNIQAHIDLIVSRSNQARPPRPDLSSLNSHLAPGSICKSTQIRKV